MTKQTEIKQLAGRIAKEIRSTTAGDQILQGRLYLEANPETVIPIITLLQREANRSRPNQSLLHGYLYLLATGLELLRYRIERGYPWAEDLIAEVKDLVLALAKDGKISGSMLSRILNAFREVRLDVGEDLTSILGELTKDEGIETANLEPAEFDELFADMVQAFGTECGGAIEDRRLFQFGRNLHKKLAQQKDAEDVRRARKDERVERVEPLQVSH